MLRTEFVGKHSYDTSARPLYIYARIYSCVFALSVIFSVTAVEAMEQESPARTEIEAYVQEAMSKLFDIDKRINEASKRFDWKWTWESEDTIRKNMENMREQLELERERYICVRDLLNRLEQHFESQKESEIAKIINRQQYLIDKLFVLETRSIDALIKYYETRDEKFRNEFDKAIDEKRPFQSEFHGQNSHLRRVWKERFHSDLHF